jgi:hypothetical protein
MARIYYGSFKSIQDIDYRVELWDAPSGSTTSGTELKLAGEGFVIDREGEGTATYEEFLRPSRCSTEWVMPNNTVLADFISISTEAENNWAMIVYREDAPIWIGRVIADQMTRLREAIQAKPRIKLAAVDGLELLKGFRVSDLWFTDGIITGSQLFRKCLEQIELSEYWVVLGINSNYFYDASLMYASAAALKGIHLLSFNLNAFVKNFDPMKDVRAIDVDAGYYADSNMLTCTEAMEQICAALQVRFIHEMAGYWMVPVNGYFNTTLAYRRYSYTLGYQGTGTYTHRQTLASPRPQWEAKPSLYYQPAAKLVRIDTQRRLAGSKYRTYQNAVDTIFSSEFTGIPTGTTPDDAPMRIKVLVKFTRAYPSGKVENQTQINYRIYLRTASGTISYLQNDGYWSSAVNSFEGKVDTRGQKTTWNSYMIEHQCTTAPATYDRLFVDIDFVYSVVKTYSKSKGWQVTASALKPFWGSVQVAFADSSAYQNPDFVFDVEEIFSPGTTSALNSTEINLDIAHYSSDSKYAIGNILAYNGTTNVVADDWFGGWDSVTHGTLTEMIGTAVGGCYKDFLQVVRGGWVDSGTLTAIKTLYFDGGAWVLNGCSFKARSEAWDGEWLYLAPTYSGLTSTGEGYKIDPNKNDDKVNYALEAVAEMNGSINFVPEQVLEFLINDAEGAPTTQPTINTRWEVMLEYVDSSEVVRWHVQEHNASIVYTNGTHTITNGYELIICNTTDGNVVVNLPNATESKGKKYYFIKTASAHVVTISGGSYNINGSSATTINQLYGSKTIISDGAQWYIISSV